MDDPLVTIARFEETIEAELAKQKLADFDIEAVLTGENTATTFAGVYAAIDIELQVRQSQAEKAREILQGSNEQE